MQKYLILIFIIFNGFLYSEYIISDNKYDINRYEDKIFIYVQQNNYKGVKELLDNGIDTNILDIDKISPLMIASFNGFNDIVDLLIKNNADVNIVNNFGYSAIMAAAAG
ncbi:ankyrin repeat domain-containing protein, partial [Brachyspira hampsonii]